MTKLLAKCPHCQTRFPAPLNAQQLDYSIISCKICSHKFKAKGNIYQFNDDMEQVSEVSPTLATSLTTEPEDTATNIDESWAEQLIADELKIQAEEIINKRNDAKAENPNKDTENPSIAESFDLNSDINLQDIPQGLREIHSNIDTSQNNLSHLQDPETLAINPETNNRRKIFKTLGINLLIFITLSLVIVGQYLYFNFDNLAQNTKIRPYLLPICKYLPCQVPRYSNLDEIKATELILRAIPEKPNILVLNTILTNNSLFEQDFPYIHVVFTDINDNQVTKIKFSPKEYKLGELTKYSLMPAQNPIHIVLEIADPGEQAVNYFVELHYLTH